jgi:alginate O-acetyltransferase complex protein AlgI
MASGSGFYRARGAVMRALRMLLVFAVVTIGWLLFKLPDFSQVLSFLATLRSNIHLKPSLGGPMMILLYAAPVVAYHFHYLLRREHPLRPQSRLRPLFFGLMLAMIALNSGPGTPFIYFQF